MITFKTKAGTELPIQDLKGKPYLQVAYRILWFREEHKDWGIETELVKLAEGGVIAKAVIRDENNRVIAQAHKTETKRSFDDYIEKAETGAIGRALALCGYGTQFTEELNEGERIVDSPVEPVKPAPTSIADKIAAMKPPKATGSGIVTWGRDKGKRLSECTDKDLQYYLSKEIEKKKTGSKFRPDENFIADIEYEMHVRKNGMMVDESPAALTHFNEEETIPF